MNTRLLKALRRNFSTDYVSRETNRLYMRQWCASIRNLGSKWLLANQGETA